MITDYFCNTITVLTPGTQNEYGEMTYTSTSLKCRVILAKANFGQGVNMIVLEGKVFSSTEVPVNSKITFDNITYQVYSCKKCQDKSKIVFYKSMLKGV
jgi:stress response protein SCP2